MIQNYLLSAWRNILRNKLYAAINIFCLSVGITGAILIAMLLNHELSFDRYHNDYHNIYLLNGEYTIGGSTDNLAITSTPLGPALKNEFTEIKEYVRFRTYMNMPVRTEKAEFIEDQFLYTDSTVFNVFSHIFVAGGPQGALAKPRTVVLTRSTAEKYFGKTDVVGESLRINQDPFLVTAVIEDVPKNSIIRFDALLSISTNEYAYNTDPNFFWNISPLYTFIQMHEGKSIHSMLGNMDFFMDKYLKPAGDMFGATAKYNAVPIHHARFQKVPMSMHTASKTSLMILLVVAIFLIVIAAVNYTNLATARAGIRAREIGVRKVTGATSGQIIRQFLSESMLVAIFAFLLSLLLVEMLLPGFNLLAEKSFVITDLFNGYFLLQILLITLITGLLAGAYPAFYLSSLQPASILKPGYQKRSGPAALRKGLVILQFAISIMMVAGTLTVRMQLNFIHNKDLGINVQDRLVLSIGNNLSNEKLEQLEITLRDNPMILATTKTSSVPGGGFNTLAISSEADFGDRDAKITVNMVDQQFLDFFEIELVKGRNFIKEQATDYQKTGIINQAAADYLGWHDDAIGKTIKWFFDGSGVPQRTLKIIGVMEDHNYATLEEPITPLMLYMPGEEETWRNIIVHFSPGSKDAVINFLDEKTKEFLPEYIPNIYFVHEGFYESFTYQEKLGRIFGVFAIVCIFLSFLGLFGLSSFMTEQRKREVGIRKVLGASGWGILGLFYREFSILILVAIGLAAPVSWLLLDWWLKGFVYHTSMNPYPLLIAATIAISVTLLTVSYHTLRAAAINPTESIKAD
jgi:putative ABC transport system permease protein